ncbi:MAG: HAL/PAL/TAL family ammonia-lyase [Solirubrobacteraceae bacterium]
MAREVTIDGWPLTPEDVIEIARRGARVALAPAARERIRAASELVRAAARAGLPVYGVTTGLGHHVVERVDGGDGEELSLRIVRGRANAVGEPLASELVRAAMVVRASGLAAGGAGARVEVADGLVALLNSGVHPTMPRSGSVGASDLCLMAHVGLTLVGEGEAELGGERMAAARALAAAGLEPVALGPKDGLAICSSSAVCAGTAALALADAEHWLRCAQIAAALSMEGFRANLSPLDPRVVAARPAPGQEWAAGGLRALLAGGSLTQAGAARRLQDPLSLRCVASIHGSLRAALDLLAAAVEPELGGAADNPLVLAADGEILSTGNFHVPALALALDAVAIGLAQVATAIAERQGRLKSSRLSDLPDALTPHGPGSSGFGPLGKTAQALAIEVRHLAAPLSTMGTVGADGVEDDSTGATQAALRMRDQLERCWPLVALELIVAAQAVDLASPERLGAGTAAAMACVRELVPPLDQDRPLGVDVERLAVRALRSGLLAKRVGGTVPA